jgi:dGTPase
MNVREELEKRELRDLAPYATRSAETRGRQYSIEPDPIRTAFQRDRDRIIHSKSFRRSEYKTQVFVNHEGDHYRTRLTHSLEVWQIGETIAKALRLNPDLTAAIALGHDLGHTPFGHSGEDTLNSLLPEGFRHYEHGVRVVEELEDSYAYLGQRGLNLTFEVREGILKHVVWKTKLSPEVFPHLEPAAMPTLEAQVINIADPSAFISHDLDDGLRAGIIDPDDLRRLRIYKVLSNGKSARPWTRGVIPYLVTDVIENTKRRISTLHLSSQEEVRKIPELIVDFSSKTKELRDELLAYLYDPSSTVTNSKLPFKGHYMAWKEVLAPQFSFSLTGLTGGGMATPAPCSTLPHTPLSGVRSRYRFP